MFCLYHASLCFYHDFIHYPGILRPATEYTRFLAIWGDHASILNSGYLLYTVKVIYSTDIFFTDEEMTSKINKKLNVQSLVEQPEIYIVAQCNDNIVEKLSYVAERRDDASTLDTPIEIEQIKINDKLRFFTGNLCIFNYLL